MPYYRAMGEVPRKRHTQFRDSGGMLYHEELMGAEGFSAESALLYHRGRPTAIVDAAPAEAPTDAPAGSLAPNHPLLPRHLRTHALPEEDGGDLVTGRRLLLGNEDLRISVTRATRPSPLYRNATGDELVYIEAGSAVLESVFGALPVGAGDYVVVPTSATHRWVPGEEPVRALVVEAGGHISPPRRYLSPKGQYLEHAPYCERDLRGPNSLIQIDETDVDVLVKHRGGLTRHTYAAHPFDIVGWDGCLYPYALSIHDFEPIVGSLHQPPPVHQTFEGPGFVVCSFVPRPFDFHPEAIPAPYNHANVDSDEVLFYVGGDFMSRKGAGIGQGSISLHPAGFVHGPQPGSVEASIGAPRTDELAVMIDTFRPLQLGEAALACEDPGYPWTWAGGRRARTS